MCDPRRKQLVFIAGKRKAGTTFLFLALDVEFRPAVKDRGWRETREQVRRFLDSSAATGVVAKANAVSEPERLLAELGAAGATQNDVSIVLLDRAPYYRFLSFLAHERKRRWRDLKRVLAEFDAEERAAEAGFDALEASPFPVTRLTYETLAAGAVDQVAGVGLKPHPVRQNARDEVLPLFGVISRLVESDWYPRVRDTRAIKALKKFYYAHIATRRARPNGFVRCVTLGSVAGPIDGQRRITGLFLRNTGFATYLLDYDGHRRWWGPAKIAIQAVRSCWLAFFIRVDAVYIAVSRTKLGLLRDWILLSPLRWRGARVVAHVHGADFEDFYLRQPALRRIKRRQLAKIDTFVFLHEALLTDLDGRSSVLRNPIPGFANADAPRARRGDKLACGFISSFIPGKGIEAFADMAEALGNEASYCVAGGVHPKFQAYGERTLTMLNERPEIEHAGYLVDPTPFYLATDILVFPTEYASEALPGVLLEALAFGCLPVVRRTNRLTEIFADSPARWFSSQQELVDTLRSLIATHAGEILKTRGACSEWVRDHFPAEAEWAERLERHLVGWPGSQAAAPVSGM